MYVNYLIAGQVVSSLFQEVTIAESILVGQIEYYYVNKANMEV